jgi:hypothetical protein
MIERRDCDKRKLDKVFKDRGYLAGGCNCHECEALTLWLSGEGVPEDYSEYYLELARRRRHEAGETV